MWSSVKRFLADFWTRADLDEEVTEADLREPPSSVAASWHVGGWSLPAAAATAADAVPLHARTRYMELAGPEDSPAAAAYLEPVLVSSQTENMETSAREHILQHYYKFGDFFILKILCCQRAAKPDRELWYEHLHSEFALCLPPTLSTGAGSSSADAVSGNNVEFLSGQLLLLSYPESGLFLGFSMDEGVVVGLFIPFPAIIGNDMWCPTDCSLRGFHQSSFQTSAGGHLPFSAGPNHMLSQAVVDLDRCSLFQRILSSGSSTNRWFYHPMSLGLFLPIRHRSESEYVAFRIDRLLSPSCILSASVWYGDLNDLQPLICHGTAAAAAAAPAAAGAEMEDAVRPWTASDLSP